MRYVQIIVVLMFSIFESCTSTSHIQGTYTNVYFGIAGGYFKFFQHPNKFEYYSWTEGGIRSYSTGTWKQYKRSIVLNGYNNKNINLLDIKGNVQYDSSENKDKIVVKYKDSPLDTFTKGDIIISKNYTDNLLDTSTKVDVVINRDYQIRVPEDTVFFVDAVVKTIQIKSYLEHEGFLFSSPPLIDTLYSPEIEVANPGKHKLIKLKFNVFQKNFFRVKLTDTLTLKNKRTIVWHNRKFKKTKE